MAVIMCHPRRKGDTAAEEVLAKRDVGRAVYSSEDSD